MSNGEPTKIPEVPLTTPIPEIQPTETPEYPELPKESPEIIPEEAPDMIPDEQPDITPPIEVPEPGTT